MMQNSLKKEAKRLTKVVDQAFKETKEKNPHLNEYIALRSIAFPEENLKEVSDELRKHVEICCANINGLCYVLGLEMGKFKNSNVLRSIQFTLYVDRELTNLGYKEITHEKKHEILDEMDMAVSGWEDVK